MAQQKALRPSNFSFFFVLINALTYMTLIIGKSSLDAILPSLMKGSNRLLTNNEEAALLVSVGHVGYFISKVVAGMLLDCEMFHTISSNYLMIVFIITGCMASLFLMSVSYTTIMLMMGWFVFRGISSWLWIVMTRLIYNRFRQSKNSIVAWSFLSVGSRSGQFIGALIFSIMLMLGLSWRIVLISATLILFMCIVGNTILFFREKAIERKQEYLLVSSGADSLLGDSLIGWSEASTDEEGTPTKELRTMKESKLNAMRIQSPIIPNSPIISSDTNDESPVREIGDEFVANRHWILSLRLWTMVIASTCVSILFEINSFFPIYLLNHHSMKTELAALYSTPLYFSAFISLAASAIIYDQLTHTMKSVLTLFSLVSALVSFLTISLFPEQPLFCVLIMGFIIGFSLAPVHYLPSNVFSIFFGGKESCAKISAIMECISFAVTAVVDAFIIGPLINGGNWTNYFTLMVGISILAIIMYSIFFQFERRNVY